MTTERSDPYLPHSPQDVLRELVKERVFLADRTYHLYRPEDSDLLLNHPATRTANVEDDYMPYWTDLWPGARMLGKALLREEWPEGMVALEVGCGLGLPGIVALSLGMKVIFSDYDGTALELAARNARLNGQTNFELLQMDWRFPPPDLRVPLILASDLIYENRNVVPLIRLMGRVLTPEGVCLLTDPDRTPAERFRETLREEGMSFTTELVRAGEPGGCRTKGTLYRIRNARGGNRRRE